MRLVLLEARNEGGGRVNPSERVRATAGAASCVVEETALASVQMRCRRDTLCKIQKEDEKTNGNENMIKTEGNKRGSEGYVIYKNVKL